MEKLEWRVQRKKEIYALYLELLRDCKGIRFFKQDISITTPWFIDVLAEQRDELIVHLKQNGIGTRTMYPPINTQAAYNLPGEFPVAALIGVKGLWLPSANQLTDEQVRKVCSVINGFYQKA